MLHLIPEAKEMGTLPILTTEPQQPGFVLL
jgi:hypothetical protein